MIGKLLPIGICGYPRTQNDASSTPRAFKRLLTEETRGNKDTWRSRIYITQAFIKTRKTRDGMVL